jgi:ankyrin repeat protein
LEKEGSGGGEGIRLEGGGAGEDGVIRLEREGSGGDDVIRLERESSEGDDAILLAGEGAEDEAKQTIQGVTETLSENKFVIKGDKPKDLVDRSIVRIKGDPQKQGRELKMKTLAGSTDLMKAAIVSDAAKIAELLSAGDPQVQIRKTDAEGRTVLHYAAMSGSVEVLKLLVGKGAQVNTVDSKRRSALFFAALYKHAEAFDFLVSQGARAAQQALGGMTIAMVAVANANMQILKSAVQAGVRLEAKDQSGKTALDHARKANNAEMIAFLEANIKPAAGAKPKAAAGA